MKFKLVILLLAVAATVAASALLGPRLIVPFGLTGTDREILFSIRLPRVLVALLMGMALGASGAVLQGILRNPLADPYILGISSGASLTAVLGLISGISLLGSFTVPVMAFAGAILSGVLVGVMGWKRGGIWPERLLLAGVGLSFLFSALLMLLMSVSTDEGLRRATLWIFGDLSLSDWPRIPYGLLLVSAGILLSTTRARALNALILGDEFAHSLGFAPQRERFILFVAVGLMTAASVSLGGMIGFIGLLIPHIMRFFLGADSRLLITTSALGGGALLCIADLISRSLLPPMELPAGVITAIIGAPYFLFLLRRKNVLSI
jgi:iron complex transport system permease protein